MITMKGTEYLEDVKRQFLYYKLLGERAMSQVEEKDLFFQHHDESNSVAQIVKHLSGNMLSRWTDFLHTDGEKDWRNRDGEFTNDIGDRDLLFKTWETGWNCLLSALDNLEASDLERIVYIRHQGHTVVEAINRQVAHYAYHVGQIVFLCKLLKPNSWQSLTIPKGASVQYNQKKFDQPKQKGHFTDDFLQK